MSFLDLESLALSLNSKKTKCYDFELSSNSFRKVAFDVYKKNDGTDTLWELRDGPDGKKYLFALYDTEESDTLVAESGQDAVDGAPVKKASVWSLASDRAGQNITLSLKGTPIYRFAGESYGFDSSNVHEFCNFIQRKTAEPDFVKSLLDNMPASKRAFVLSLMNNGE